MLVAPISAPRWVSRVQRGPYHLVLAHLALRYPDVAEYYRIARRTDVDTIILDNGAFEEERLHNQALDKAIELVKPDIVVLPDAPYDPVETLKRARGYVQTQPDVKSVMFVPHGETVEDRRRCLEVWNDWWVTSDLRRRYRLVVGIPSYRREGTPKRAESFSGISALPVHLLGVSDMAEFLDIDLPGFPDAIGVDTSYPFVAAAHGELLRRDTPKRPLGEIEQYDDLAEPAIRLARLNTLLLKLWGELGEHTPRIPLSFCWQVVAEAPFVTERQYTEDLVFSPELALAAAGVPSGLYLATKEKAEDRIYRYATPFQFQADEVIPHGRLVEVVQEPYRR